MKKIILFYGSFDPIHNGHLKIASDALKVINGDKLYFGINKNSNSKNLTPFSKRKKMIELAIKNKNKFDISNIKFDYKDLDSTYENILNMCNDGNEYYILIGQDQLDSLNKWYKFDILKNKFKFIIANRGNAQFDIKNEYIYLNNKNYNISSKEIKEGKYRNIDPMVKKFIIENNVYLEKQIKKYMSNKRFKHVKSVKNLALKIYKNNKNSLDKNKIITASLLHDIAKEYPNNKLRIIMKRYYPGYFDENKSIFHQYVGEYLAKKKFYIEDNEILEAIKFHTTGNKNMSKLAKLIYVADKLDPSRGYDSGKQIENCINNLETGFIEVLKENLSYLKNHEIKFLNNETKNTIKYYLEGESENVRTNC